MTDAPRRTAPPTAIRLDRWTVTSGSNVQQPGRGRHPAATTTGRRRPRATARSTRCSRPSTRRSRPSLGGQPLLARLRRPCPRRGPGRRGPGHRPDRAAGGRRGRPRPTAGTRARSPPRTPSPRRSRRTPRRSRRCSPTSPGRARPRTPARSGSAGRRATPRRRDRVRRDGRPLRHHRVVQPLGGEGAPAPAIPIDADAFNRFEAAGWEARAGSYAFLTPITGRVIGALLGAVEAGTDTQLLDVGSGPGDLAAAAAERGADPVGIDVAPSMVRRAAMAHPGIPFRVGSFEAIPGGAGSFDAVVGNFVFNHVGRPGVALAEAHRVLRPGGRLALSTWDAARHNRILGLLLDADRGGRRAAAARPARRADELPHRRRAAGPVRGRRVRGGRRVAPQLRGADPRRRHAVARRARLGGADPAARDRPGPRGPGAHPRRVRPAVRAARPARRDAGDPGRGPGRPRARARDRRARSGSPTPASPARSPRRPSCASSRRPRPCPSPRSGTSSRPCATAARTRASSRSRAASSARSARTPTCCGRSTCRSSARSACPSGSRSSACRGSGSRPWSASTRSRRRSPRPTRSCGRGRGRSRRLQHRRRRPDGRRARGTGLGRGRERPGRGDLRARRARRRHPVGVRQPHPVRGHRPARGRRGGPRRPRSRRRGRRAADDARVRRPERRGVAPPVARRVRDPRAQPRRGWSPGRGPSAGRAGSTCSGWTSTGTRPSPCAPRRSPTSPGRPSSSGSSARIPAPPRTDDPGIETAARAGAARRRRWWRWLEPGEGVEHDVRADAARGHDLDRVRPDAREPVLVHDHPVAGANVAVSTVALSVPSMYTFTTPSVGSVDITTAIALPVNA